jgi:hypothetical protein
MTRIAEVAVFLMVTLALMATYAGGAQAQDFFSGYIQGREAAIRDNQRDAMMLAYTIKQQIDNDFAAFNLSGDWVYICHAYMLGSLTARKHLFDNDMRCRFYRE